MRRGRGTLARALEGDGARLAFSLRCRGRAGRAGPGVADLHASDGTCTHDDADDDCAERLRHVPHAPHRAVRESRIDNAERWHDDDDGNADQHDHPVDVDDVHIDSRARIHSNDDDAERLRCVSYAARAAVRESRPHGPRQQSARHCADHLDVERTVGTDDAIHLHDDERSYGHTDNDDVCVYIPSARKPIAGPCA